MSGIIESQYEIPPAGRPTGPPGADDVLETCHAFAKCGLILNSKVGRTNKILWIAASIVFAAPQSAFACAACTGRSDDAAAHGLNAAVFTLLLMLLMVYGAIGCSLAYLVRRASKHPLTPPDAREGLFNASHWMRSFTVRSRATINRVASILSSLNRQKPQRFRKEWYDNGRD